jgi:hypothetical protein
MGGDDIRLVGQCRLAIPERTSAQSLAVDFQKIETPGAEIPGRAFHQCFEVRLAIAIADDDLGIDHG